MTPVSTTSSMSSTSKVPNSKNVVPPAARRSRKASLIYLGVSAAATVAIATGVAIASGRMNAAAVFLAIATALLGWTVWLLFSAAHAAAHELAAGEAQVASGRRRKELEREKQALLKALKELEFDHEMGKVSDKDFREIGGLYRGRAVRVMRQLDEAGGEYRALIERELAGRRKARAGEAATTESPRSAPESTVGTGPEMKTDTKADAPKANARPGCSSCSTENDADAEFCKKCGSKLGAVEATP
jgi:hypothetical protein